MEDSQHIFKRKRREGTQHKWTPAETEIVIDYLKTTISSGQEIEKPTAPSFYATLLTQQPNLKGLSTDKLRQKVCNLKASYLKALQWRNDVGQRLLNKADREQSFLYALNLRCPWFDSLDEIFGSKCNNVNDSSNPSYPSHEEVLELKFDDINEVSSNMVLPDSDLFPTSSELNPKKAKPTNALALLSEALLERNELLKRKIDFEEKKLAAELQWKDRELSIQERRLDMEKELRILEIEKEERIQMFKIQEKFRIKQE